MICAKCGKPNDKDTRFCIECGANLVEQQEAVAAPAQLPDTDTRQARLEDFEITQDASNTAPLSPISGPDGPAVPTAPSFKPTSREGQSNQRTADAGGSVPASAYYAGRQVPGQNNPLHAQPAMANNYPGTQIPPVSRTPNSTTKDGKTPYIIIAAIAGAAFLLCLAAFITYSMGTMGSAFLFLVQYSISFQLRNSVKHLSKLDGLACSHRIRHQWPERHRQRCVDH
jgi:hypothetical protein